MWLSLCFLLGILFAFASYWREKQRKRFRLNTIYLLSLIRFIGVTFLSFLLIRPITETHQQNVEKPITVVLHDNSISVQQHLQANPNWKDELKEKISGIDDQSEIAFYAFDGDLTNGWDSLNAKGTSTNMSAALEKIGIRYAGRNLAAVVMISDGLFNEGNYPIYAAQNLQVPIHTIGIGDTTIYKDVFISDVQCNKTTFLGNEFPILVNIETRLAQQQNLEVVLKNKGQIIDKKNIRPEGKRTFHSIQFNTQSKQLGIQHYTVDISTIEGEKNTSNNHYDCFIEVLDDRQKILIVGAAPHPDIQAIMQSINQSESFKAEFVTAEEWKGKAEDNGLTIFHGLPNQAQQVNIINGYIANKKPCLFVWSQSTQMSLFNLLETGIQLQGANGNREERTPIVDGQFNYFQISDEIKTQSNQWPPLSIPFGKLALSPGVVSYFQQQVGNLNTGFPLVAFQSADVAKIGCVMGEGLWRWRMTSFVQTKNHEAFDGMIGSWAQFLVDKNKDHLFKVNTKKKWAYNQPVVFQANLYDESMKPLMGQNIQLTLWNEKGEKRNYPFVPGNNGYQLELGLLEPGGYQFKAEANNGAQKLESNGTFIVENVQLEMMNTWANHDVLRNLAKETSGTFFNSSALDSLESKLRNQQNFVSVAYDESNREEWIDWWPILLILLTSFGAEWMIRKWQGGY